MGFIIGKPMLSFINTWLIIAQAARARPDHTGDSIMILVQKKMRAELSHDFEPIIVIQ